MKATDLAAAIRRSSEEIAQLDAFKRGEDAACTTDAPASRTAALRDRARRLVKK